MPHIIEAATLCANPACTRTKRHPGLCTDEIAARTGLTVEQVKTVLDFEAGTNAVDNPQNIQAGDQVKLEISEEPDPVTATVVRVYRDAIGSLVADVEIRPGDVRPQNVEFLTRVNASYAQTVTRLAREYRACCPADGPIPTADYRRIVNQLHVAADAAGINRPDAARDLFDEIDAGPVTVSPLRTVS